MKAYFKHLDRLLRGEATSDSALKYGGVMIPLDKILLVSLLLAAFSGLCIGTFCLINGADAQLQRMLSTLFKVPILFFLTLFITFPSLYAFNAIIGTRLEITSLLRLLVSAIGVMVAVLASLGPIVAFFSFSATSYPFMLLLNVAVFTVAGLLGFRFLYRTLDRLHIRRDTDPENLSDTGPLSELQEQTAVSMESECGEEEAEEGFRWLGDTLQPRSSVPGPLEKTSKRGTDPKVRMMFQIWILVFGLVGAQMGWVLRPFIGDPDVPFEWFAPRESSFFEAIIAALEQLFLF